MNLDGIKGNADTILGVGDYGSSAKLTLDKVELQANNYTSPYALIYVYNDSVLNVENNSVLTAKNEKTFINRSCIYIHGFYDVDNDGICK